jgi:histidinol-phosphatase (PHP family)
MLPDYHNHTVYSDGQSEHRNYLLQAVYAGIDELGFSDHFTVIPNNWTVKKEYINQLKQELNFYKHLDDLPVSVKFGAEIDYIPGKEKEIKWIIHNLPLDYVIGSVHCIGNWNFDTDPEGFKSINIDETYEIYFNQLRKAILSDLYDIIGHADLIKKFGYYPSADPSRWFKKVIRSVKRKNKVVEINTNGLNKPCKEFYPSEDFIRMCFQMNIPVTLGSDAHSANEVGQYFDKAIEILKRTGYRKVATFNNRKRIMQYL